MPLLIFIVFPILEIYVFIQVGDRFGYMNAIFAILASMIVGVGIVKSQAQYMFRHLQQSMAQRQVPEARAVHSLLIFIGGILLVVPGFITSLAGLVFILPGTRHLLGFWLKARLFAQIGLGKLGIFAASGLGGIRFGSGGFGRGFGFGSGRVSGVGSSNSQTGFRTGPEAGHSGFSSNTGFESPISDVQERDVTPRVIDVTPISSETRSSSGEKDSPSRSTDNK